MDKHMLCSVSQCPEHARSYVDGRSLDRRAEVLSTKKTHRRERRGSGFRSTDDGVVPWYSAVPRIVRVRRDVRARMELGEMDKWRIAQ